jgi:hypothetical protein
VTRPGRAWWLVGATVVAGSDGPGMFRFRSNGMVIRCLLSWTFDRLPVPLTFRPRPWIESHRAARADTSGLVNSGPVSRPHERLSLHTAEVTGSIPVTPASPLRRPVGASPIVHLSDCPGPIQVRGQHLDLTIHNSVRPYEAIGFTTPLARYLQAPSTMPEARLQVPGTGSDS